MLKNKKNAIIFTLFAMLLWGSSIPVIKISYRELGIVAGETGLYILTAGIRFFMAGVLTFILFLLLGRKEKSTNKLDYKLILILAVVQTFLQYIFYYIGLSNISGVKSSIIQAANSFLVVIIARIMLPKDEINSRIIFAIIIGFLGVVITSRSGANDSSGVKLTGEGFILIATTFNALSSVFIRKYANGQNPYLLTALQFAIGAIGLIAVGLMTAERALEMNTTAFLLLVYGAFVSATAFTIWTIVMQYHNASEFGVYKLFIPIFGSILSVLILGEVFTLRLFIGMVLVLGGSLILNLDNIKKMRLKKGLLENR